MWKNNCQYFFRSSMFFDKFAGNCSTLVYKTLIFGEKIAIFELHNTFEVAYILIKQTCWNFCIERLIFYFYKSLENILHSFWPLQLSRTRFHVIYNNRIFMVRNSHHHLQTVIFQWCTYFCYYLAHLWEASLHNHLWFWN